jgi:hypothetical protein
MNSGEMKPGADGASWEVNIPGNEASRKIKDVRGTKSVPENEGGRSGELKTSQGTRASANTSGPDFMAGFWPGEIADLERSAPNEENLFLLPDRF